MNKQVGNRDGTQLAVAVMKQLCEDSELVHTCTIRSTTSPSNYTSTHPRNGVVPPYYVAKTVALAFRKRRPSNADAADDWSNALKTRARMCLIRYGLCPAIF